MPLDPALKAVLDQLAANPGPQMHELEPSEAREVYVAMQMPGADVTLASVDDRSVPGPAGDVPVRVYRPDADGTPPVLVYFHGGGWVIGNLETHDAPCRELAARAGCVVIAVDYRLAPEARYPAAAEDCYAVTAWVAEHADALGVDAGRLAVGGDSAGGNLGAVVCQMARDRDGPAIAFQLLIYPVTDADFETGSYRENGEGYLLTTDAMRWFWGHYVPDEARRREASASPLRAASLAGLPPALVQTAEFDPLRDEGEAYGAALSAAGVPTQTVRYDGLIHGYFAMGQVSPTAQKAVDDAVEALRAAFS